MVPRSRQDILCVLDLECMILKDREEREDYELVSKT